MTQPTSYILDFDSTLVTSESLDDFAELVLANEPNKDALCAELQAITARGMAGELPFDESLTARLKLFSAHERHIDLLNELLSQKISPSALARLDWFTQNAKNIYIVSGGFEEFILPIAKKLGIPAANVYANRFIFDNDRNIVGYETGRPTSQPGGKVLQVQKLKLSPDTTIAIGDGFTDLEIYRNGAACEFWAYTETVARPSVIPHANRIITSFDQIAV